MKLRCLLCISILVELIVRTLFPTVRVCVMARVRVPLFFEFFSYLLIQTHLTLALLIPVSECKKTGKPNCCT